ncbi:amidohydrolase family protein [Amycolatopsis sp. K13G38]|uniref:Amidohydrolase family protein n=1 Tax=Amycolatopsis acididurans TaxID=2724524 RepID=A0ABX1IVF9_9PSEU|nr:amidohydrolase family protein [Amycolatopsis acididurans]NKQ51473.1 amidohydrolase family protein [Amycolatopsis acididurans]
MLIRRAEVEGGTADVRIRGEQVTEVGDLRPERDETVLDARGGALLPGLHDHHVHLLSLAAAAASLRCGPPEVTDLDGLARVLRGTTGPVRGIGYHESVAGILDRDALDRLVPGRPVRIQHRGGALWTLNTAALTQAGLLERYPDGRLWRADADLRGLSDPPDLAAVGRRLAALGITGVTDATPDLTDDAVGLLTGAGLPQRLHLLGVPAGTRLPPGVTAGPYKILRPDHEPPDWDALHDEIGRIHGEGRPVAVHAVTRESLVVTLAVLERTGSLPGDRIEHAAVVGEDLIPLLAKVNPVVVTQPGFVAERGAQYRRDIPEGEHRDLYRYASLLGAGLRVVASSDAPFASEDPWRTIAAAAHRDLAPAERVPPERVLAGYLAPPADPGGPPRRVAPGMPADLCLLHVPLREALSILDADVVATTIAGGEIL